MPDLGIAETIGALAGGGLDLGSLLGFGGAAADVGAGAAAGAGAADVGAGVAGAGEGLFGGTTGLVGTDIAAGGAGDLAALTATPGLGVAGTAADVMGGAGALGAGVGAADLLGAGAGASGADTAAQTALQTGMATGTGAIPGGPTSISQLLQSGAIAPGAGFNIQPVAGGGTTAIGGTPNVGSPSVMGTAQGFMSPGAGAGGATSVAPPVASVGPSAIDPTAAAATGAAPAAGGAPAAPAAGGTSISDLLSKLSPGNLASSAVKSITSNPLGIAAGLGGLGYNIYAGSKGSQNLQNLQNEALTATTAQNKLMGEGEALQQYLTSGTLPPQYMATINNAVQAAKANAISNAAAQGQSTDPTKNTTLASTLQSIDNQIPDMITKVGGQLAQSGQGLISAGAGQAGLSGQLYSALVSNETNQAANVGRSIANLAAALAGKSPTAIGGTNVTVSQAA